MAIDYTRRTSGPAVGGAQPTSPVSLSKISLTKAAPAVSLTKQGSASGVLRVNLNWDARPAAASGGFLKRLAASAQGQVDLDLGCLYEYADGSKSVVQALGNALRDTRAGDPIVWLDGDDRSGAVSEGENLFVDLRHVSEVRRILVFAYIYEGAPNWADANAVVTLHPASGPQIEVRLDEADPRSRMCAIAMLENTGGELSVRREVRYVAGLQKELDQAYGWGLRWSAGRK